MMISCQHPFGATQSNFKRTSEDFLHLYRPQWWIIMIKKVLAEPAYAYDIGQGIARIPLSIAEELDLRENDIAKITGERSTYVRVRHDQLLSSGPEGPNTPYIRLDMNSRRNTKISSSNVI